MKTLLNDPYFWVLTSTIIGISILFGLLIKMTIEEKLFSNKTEIEQDEPKIN